MPATIVKSFVSRRLEQLPPVNARLSTVVFDNGVKMGIVWVSKIKLGTQVWMRVEDEKANQRRHYRGDMSVYDAGREYFAEIASERSV